MSQASPEVPPVAVPATEPAPCPDVPRSALKVVLFGMPAAGKSSLLGALAQASQTQSGTLRGTIVDHSGGLAELQRLLYQDRPIRTTQEIVLYPVTLQGLPTEDGSAPPPDLDAILVDCDGEAAYRILQRQSLDHDSGQAELVQAILDADALILVADASAPSENIKKDFGSFARFLRVLEQHRSQCSEINGLPVYLVLTKCDLLAKPTDTTSTWVDRIEDTKRQVDRKFREFLAQQAAREQQPFGKIDLNVWATAVHRPALGGAQARPQEPYAVAELFRKTLDSARQFRDLRRQAGVKVGMAVAAMTGVLALLLLLGLLFLSFRPGVQATALENEIRALRSTYSDNPLDRFKEPLDSTIKQLREFEKHPDFSSIPTDLQDYVEKTRRELEAYRKYDRTFTEKVREPRHARNDADLEEIEKALQDLPLPPEYETPWSQTRVGKRRERSLREASILRRTIEHSEKQLRELIKRGKDIKEKETLTTAPEKIRQLLNDADNLSLREDNREARVPGTDIPWDTVLRFERVANAWRDWRDMREDLKKRL